MKDCLVLPVSVSISVHMASELQIMQGSFLFKPGLHQAVGLSFISPSLIKLFRDVSKVFRVKYWTQHLKKPPLFLQSLAKLDCSWKIESLRIRYGIWTGTLLYYISHLVIWHLSSIALLMSHFQRGGTFGEHTIMTGAQCILQGRVQNWPKKHPQPLVVTGAPHAINWHEYGMFSKFSPRIAVLGETIKERCWVST